MRNTLLGVVAMQLLLNLTTVQGHDGPANQQTDARITALENLLQHFSRTGNELFLTGANLHVRNGTGTTNGIPNTYGNVIIGYNEPRPDDREGGGPFPTNLRTGSHMLVVGKEHNYTSFGGIVVGERNSTAGEYGTVAGGRGNRANGRWAVVAGGNQNLAAGTESTVSGGTRNTAAGISAAVSGGVNNLALGDESSVGGGSLNTASGFASSVSGGSENTSQGAWSSVSGGQSVIAAGPHEHPDTH